MAMMPHKGQ